LLAVDAERIGRAAVALGAGRLRKGDPIDPSVGVIFDPKIGDRLSRGGSIGRVHARDEAAARAAIETVHHALTLSDERVEPPPLVHGWID
jgi:thymidine phosphorylase